MVHCVPASFPVRPAGVGAAGLLWLSLAVRHPRGSHSRLRVRTRRALLNDSAVTSVDDVGTFKPCGSGGDNLPRLWEHWENHADEFFLAHSTWSRAKTLGRSAATAQLTGRL